MTRLLSLFGLMRVSEHKKVVQEEILQSIKAANRASDEKGFRLKAEKRADDFEAKFKKAVADLEKQAGEIAVLRRDYARRGELIQEARNERDRAEAEAKFLRPDALAMRRKRQMDRDRRKGNSGSVTAPKDGLVAINADAPETPQVQP